MTEFSEIEDHPPRTRPDWRRAWRALQVIRANPERTDQVYEMNVALDGGDSERHFQGLLAEPGGPDLLLEQPDLLARLADFRQLETLDPNSLGGRYLRMMSANGYDADGLRNEASKVREFAELFPGPARSWFANRENCVHDLLHVVTGYGQDPAGETALLAFTDGLFGRRFRMRVIRFGLVASVLSSPLGSLHRTVAFSARARRRGCRARIPFSFRWEDALAHSLQSVREQLRVAPVEIAHPAGVLRGTMEAPWSLVPAS